MALMFRPRRLGRIKGSSRSPAQILTAPANATGVTFTDNGPQIDPKDLLDFLREHRGRALHVMEVCGRLGMESPGKLAMDDFRIFSPVRFRISVGNGDLRLAGRLLQTLLVEQELEQFVEGFQR